MRRSETPPAMCSACFGQYPDRVHIDFESSWDGPLIEGGTQDREGNVISRIPVSIDELVLCEECIAAAAAELGFSRDEAEKVKELRKQIRELKASNAGLTDYNAKLEGALAVKREQAERIAEQRLREQMAKE
jgi:hypothetical protein